MVINDPAALANAVICAVIVCALMCHASPWYLHSCLLAGIDLREHSFPIYLWSLRTVPLAGGNGKRDDMRRRVMGTG